MSVYILLLTNLILPIFSSLFIFIFFLYFIFVKPSKTSSFRYFTVFLISFSIYLFSRSLQVLIGIFPVPLLINNFRLLLLCSVVAPMLVLTTDLLRKNRIKYRKTIIFGVGLTLGIIYVIFNTLGTTGIYVVSQIGRLTIFDTLTPTMRSPFYGREITQIVQILVGLFLLSGSLIKILELKKKSVFKELIKDKLFIINIGIFIFGVSFVIGSVTKQWSIYYLASVLSALIIGMGVLIDVRQLHLQVEMFIPFIKEDLLKNISFSNSTNENVSEMLNLLGKKNSLDTFLIINFKNSISKDVQMSDYEKISDIVKKRLEDDIGDENYIIFPLSSNLIGIAISVNEGLKNVYLMDIVENLRNEMAKKIGCVVTIGIGRSYKEIENLRISYFEALNALEYAEKFGKNNIIHVNNINEPVQKRGKYPYKEKEELLLAVRLGDIENAKKTLQIFFDKFEDFTKNKPEILKVRLYELIGSFIDSAIAGGGDDEKLYDLDIGYFNDINNLKDISLTERWLTEVVLEIVEIVSNAHNDRTVLLINKAKIYIEDNFFKQITVEDVAREVFISPSYFLHLFKEKSGFTFTDYLTEIRINNAKELLLKTNESITNIAYKVGYNDSNYFSTVFKNAEGLSPSEYRKNNQNL